MLKLYIKYKNESTSSIVNQLKIDNNKVVDENYVVEKNNGVLYGEGDDSIIFLENYVYPEIKYLFNENEYKGLIEAGFELVPNNATVGDFAIIKRKVGVRYIVSPMETIEDIASKHSISVDSIIEKNNLKSKKLFIGQSLWV